MKWKLLDLFSGIGGFSLGLERSGNFETVAFCENGKFPSRIIKKHWPHVKNYGDIKTLSADVLHADGIYPDAICGGFPCQDISLAGKRAGFSGDRSVLWQQYARLIGELRPSIVIVENPTGLLSLGLGEVLGDLAALGYDAEWHCIPATYVGAWHERDRVWIIAYPAGVGQQEPRLSWENAGRHKARFNWQTTDVIDALRRRAVPVLCREDHGVPHRMDRLTGLGNAVVHQIPEIIGRAIGPK